MNEQELIDFEEQLKLLTVSPMNEEELIVFEELSETISPVFEKQYERVTDDIKNLTKDIKAWENFEKEEVSAISSISSLTKKDEEKIIEQELSTPIQMALVEENVNIESQTFQNKLLDYGQVSPGSQNNMMGTEFVIKKYVSKQFDSRLFGLKPWDHQLFHLNLKFEMH
jgi:uncharacterized protein (UPF0335 family)